VNWSEKFATRTRGMKPSAIREILKLTQGGQVISFAGGLPAPQLFPVEELRRAAETVLTQRGHEALQYSTTEGYAPLREWVAARLGAAAAQVQIVSGSQQALDLVAKIFLNPGDAVVLGAPTYMGALRAFDAYEVDYLSVPTDDEGMLPGALEAALKTRPKLVYVTPNFDNPTGVTTSLARRQVLLQLARRYEVPVLEDNPYGELRFEGAELPHLYTLAPDIVIYAGTFSKIMVPGFRLAWVLAAPKVLTLLARAKQAADLHTATTTQMIACEVAQADFLEAHIERARDFYKAQRDLMLGALDAYMPTEVRWTRPAGGMFLWVTLPDGIDASEMAYEAVRQGVAYVPGETFFTDGRGLNTLRLSYSGASPAEIDEGVRRLGQVFAGRLGRERVY